MQLSKENWERREGVKFLKKVGIKSGQTVLDFGARVGHYSIPAAIIVGETGAIYALDKDPEALEALKQKAAHLNLRNLNLIRTNGILKLDFKAESIDFVFLYDVLHYLKPEKRKMLYAEIYRILNPAGLLSVYPKHVLDDAPLDEFDRLHTDDVKQEIQNANFKYIEKYCDSISHNDTLNYGCVLNFKRGESRQ
ncbi:class I SAM-dependent methyltransferase [candidate division KSB1 bacterium]|nr:class I SAM-dependent methyltransferase [candidate division KSB1 bacterium]